MTRHGGGGEEGVREGGGEGGGRSLPVGFEALVWAHVSSTLADCSLIAVIEFTPYVLIAIAYLCTHPMQNQDTRTDVAHKPQCGALECHRL